MATQGPTPVDTGATPLVVVRPLDRTPAPLPPGPGTTGRIPTVTAPQGPPESAPPSVAPGPGTGQRPGTSTVTFVPVVEVPVDTGNIADTGNTSPNIIPTVPNLIEVLSDGTIIIQNASALNFTGSGVTATANGSVATLNIISGSTYANSNVVTLLSNFGSNTVVTTGNITGGYFVGNGSQLTGLPATYGNANVVANLAALGSNPVSTTGNITGGYILGNGSQLTGLAATYGNANVAANLAAFANNPILTTGNIGAGNVNVTTATGNLVFGRASATGSPGLNSTGSFTVVANRFGTPTEWVFTTDGSFTGLGNITGGNVLTGGLISATGNITGGNITTAGVLKISGSSSYIDVAGTGFIQNAGQGEMQLSTVAGKPLIINTNAGAYGWNFGTAGNLTLPNGGTVSGTGNITGGNLLTGGIISSGGNISGGNVNTGAVANTGNLSLSAGANSWTFDTTGNLTVPSCIILPPNALITSVGASPAPRLNNFDSVSAVNLSASGNVTSVTVSASGNITGARFYGDVGNVTYQQTTVYYVDPLRTANYTPTGTIIKPYANVTAAIAAAVAAGITDANPATVMLLNNTTENITMAPGVYLTSPGTGTHGSPVITGVVTVTSSTGTLSSNHYSISNLRIVAPTNGHGINFTGAAAQKLFMRDMWIDASGTGDCIYMDNSNATSTVQFDVGHLTHSGSGDIYCINVTAGNCYVTDIETSGATQVAAVQNGAVLTIDGSELDANGDVVCETYGTGSLTITNSILTNTATNGNGIKINSAGSTVTVGQCLFSIPVGTGSVVYYNPAATLLGSNIAFASISFFPGTNTTIDARLLPIPLAVAVGTIASPILYGDITTSTLAQDWDLLDNNASALSFDTTGKAGVLELVTTNSAEGVKMSGFASVVGNITGGNLNTAGLSLSGNVVSALNASSSIAAGTTISAVGNITGGNILGGANVNATTHTGTTVSVTGNITGGNILGGANVNATTHTGTTVSVTGNITGGNLAISGNTATITSANYSVGYLNIPQISFAANATAALVDSGKHYYTTSASNLALTLADNSAVSWPVGTALSIVNRGTANVTVAPAAGVSLYLAGNSTSANRVVTTYGMATVMNVAANVWMINGTVV